jgi:adenosylmethionine-8-amino-7-oxononanoate aminotransferase
MTNETEVVEQPQLTHEQLQQRARECFEEIKKVLDKHSCRILPFISEPEPVGQDAAKMLISASYGIVPIQPPAEPQEESA